MLSRAAKSPKWLSWTGFVYYGETVGFVCAWIVGLAALAFSSGSSEPTQPPINQIAAADVLE